MAIQTAKRKSSKFKFIGETIAELKKVVWLTRREATYLTAIVLIVTGAAGLVLGVLDYSFTHLVDGLFLR